MGDFVVSPPEPLGDGLSPGLGPAAQDAALETHIPPLISLNTEAGASSTSANSDAFSSPSHALASTSSGEVTIDMETQGAAPSVQGDGSETPRSETPESGENGETPSKRAWTVKGLLSSLKEKVQEPSDASAPVNKFYYDSINMFQGLQDFSESSSDDEDLDDTPPRASQTRSNSDTTSLNEPMSFLRTPNRQNPPRQRRRQNSGAKDGLPAPSSPTQRAHSQKSRSQQSLSTHHGGDDTTTSHPSSKTRSDAGISSDYSLGSSPGSSGTRSSYGDSRLGLEYDSPQKHPDWDGNGLVALDFESPDEQASFLPSSESPLESDAHKRERRARKSRWWWRLWRAIRRQQTWVFLLILGICAAMLGLAMEETMHLLVDGRNRLARLTSNYFVNYMLWVAFALALSLLSALLVHFVAPYSAGSGIPAVKSILSGVLMEHYLSFRTLVTKVLGLVCVYSAGLFVGKEGPYVHIATALASQLARLPMFEKIQRNEGLKLQLFAAGCAAGVAVTFGAPIGGVIFSIEVTTTYYLIQNLSKGFFCAIVATLFVKLIDQKGLIVAFFSTDFLPAPYTSYELVAFSLIGIAFGLLGVLFNWFVKKLAQLRRNYKILNQSRYGQVLFIAALSALVTFPVLPLRTGPTSVLNDLFATAPLSAQWTSPNIYFMLATVAILEFVMCAISIGLPIPCGLYTPMFILGAALGRLIGEVLQHIKIIPGGIVPAGYAVVGAAAFAAGTTRTLSSSIICFELTRQMEHLLPVLLAVLIASAVGNFFGPSIYDELLKMKGLPYMPPFKPSHGSGNKTAKAIMRKDVLFLTTESTFQDVQNLLIQSHYASFPLVQSRRSRALLGLLPRPLLESTIERLESELSSLAHRQIEVLNVALQHGASQPNQQQTAVAEAKKLESGATPPLQSSDTEDPTAIQSSTSSLSSGASMRASSDSITVQEKKQIEPTFKSTFGGISASLHLGEDAQNLPESQQLQRVMQDLTQQAMSERVGFSRSTPGLDSSPFQLPVTTTHSKVHFLFAMLGLNAAYILDQGELVGVITKRDLINLQ